MDLKDFKEISAEYSRLNDKIISLNESFSKMQNELKTPLPSIEKNFLDENNLDVSLKNFHECLKNYQEERKILSEYQAGKSLLEAQNHLSAVSEIRKIVTSFETIESKVDTLSNKIETLKTSSAELKIYSDFQTNFHSDVTALEDSLKNFSEKNEQLLEEIENLKDNSQSDYQNFITNQKKIIDEFEEKLKFEQYPAFEEFAEKLDDLINGQREEHKKYFLKLKENELNESERRRIPDSVKKKIDNFTESANYFMKIFKDIQNLLNGFYN